MKKYIFISAPSLGTKMSHPSLLHLLDLKESAEMQAQITFPVAL